MGQETYPIQPTTFFRQDSEPTDVPDGALWINPSDGTGNDTSSRFYWNGTDSVWELDSAVGQSEPSYPVSGSFWRDTTIGSAKQYDGSAWQTVGVSADRIVNPTVDSTRFRSSAFKSVSMYETADTGTTWVTVGSVDIDVTRMAYLQAEFSVDDGRSDTQNNGRVRLASNGRTGSTFGFNYGQQTGVSEVRVNDVTGVITVQLQGRTDGNTTTITVQSPSFFRNETADDVI